MGSVKDNINPQHYKGSTSLECIECMRVAMGEKAVWNFCLCNAFKYMWRYKNKNGKEDLTKAKWYLDYVSHDIELGNDSSVPDSTIQMYSRLNDLYISIGDKIANNGGEIDA